MFFVGIVADVPVAVNCTVLPMPTGGRRGLTAMDCSVAVPAAVTVQGGRAASSTASRVAHYHTKLRAVVALVAAGVV